MTESRSRRYLATFEQHDGSRDETNNPTYPNDGDWTPVITDWFCELEASAGGETVRGRQVTSQTTHVLTGDYALVAAVGVNSTMRCTVGPLTRAGITRVYDPDGLRRNMIIELRREQ